MRIGKDLEITLSGYLILQMRTLRSKGAYGIFHGHRWWPRCWEKRDTLGAMMRVLVLRREECAVPRNSVDRATQSEWGVRGWGKALPAGTMEGRGGQRSFGLGVVGGVARKEHCEGKSGVVQGLSHGSLHLLVGAGAISHHFRHSQQEGRNTGPHPCTWPSLRKVGTPRFSQLSIKQYTFQLATGVSSGMKRPQS